MSQQIIGIDIGTYSVKLVHLERSLMELKLLQFKEVPLNSQIRTPHHEQVGDILQQLFTDPTLTADVISMSMPGHLVSSRVIEMPFTNYKKISQTVEYELEGFVPFPMEELFFDFHIMGQTATTSQVLCAYLLDKTMANYMDVLEKVSVHPKYLGADFVDLSGISNAAMLPQEGHYAILDIGHSKSNFLIMEGRKLRYARTMGVAGLQFTRSIQRVFNLNYEKADSMKTERGKLTVREEDADQVARILNHVGQELVAGIKQTQLSFANAYGNFPITAVYCCGGGSRLAGIQDYLSYHLRLNVLDLDCLGFITHQLDEPDAVAAILPQSLSSALRPVFSNRMAKINFRKGPYTYKQDWEVAKVELVKLGFWMLAIFMLGIVYYFYAGSYYDDRIATTDKKIQKVVSDQFQDISVDKKKGKKVKDYLKALKKSLNELQAQAVPGGGGEISPLRLLEEISTHLPSKKDFRFEVYEFTYKDNFISLKALTDDRKNAEKISNSLKSDLFSSVEASEPQLKTKTDWEFVVKIQVKEAGGGDEEEGAPADKKKKDEEG